MLLSQRLNKFKPGNCHQIHCPATKWSTRLGRDSVEPPAHNMGRNPHRTTLGKASLFLIYRLSARTARWYLATV
ncbi:hypothetical protein OAG77_00345 [bacterium]|nr:hypothetical protein [bacterium]